MLVIYTGVYPWIPFRSRPPTSGPSRRNGAVLLNWLALNKMRASDVKIISFDKLNRSDMLLKCWQYLFSLFAGDLTYFSLSVNANLFSCSITVTTISSSFDKHVLLAYWSCLNMKLVLFSCFLSVCLSVPIWTMCMNTTDMTWLTL